MQLVAGTLGVATFEAALPPYDLLVGDVVMPGPPSGELPTAEVPRRWPGTKIFLISGFAKISGTRHVWLDEGALLLSEPFRNSRPCPDDPPHAGRHDHSGQRVTPCDKLLE